jgi:DNA repair exonuclease SbcCD nuclease subunit
MTENGCYVIYALFLRQRPERSSPIFADELRDTGWDYIALGHHHVQTDVSQGRVAAYYAGALMIEWGGGHPEGAVLRINFSAEDGIRVEPRRLEILSTSTIRSNSPISR